LLLKSVAPCLNNKITLLDKELQKLFAPVVTALGYELVGVICLKQKGRNLDDCTKVSYQVSGVLSVTEPIPDHYTLEVSSPGLERPLFTLDHFIHFVDHKVKVSMMQPISAQRHFTGLLQRVDGHNVVVMVDGIEYSLPYAQIDKAHIVP